MDHRHGAWSFLPRFNGSVFQLTSSRRDVTLRRFRTYEAEFCDVLSGLAEATPPGCRTTSVCRSDTCRAIWRWRSLELRFSRECLISDLFRSSGEVSLISLQKLHAARTCVRIKQVPYRRLMEIASLYQCIRGPQLNRSMKRLNCPPCDLEVYGSSTLYRYQGFNLHPATNPSPKQASNMTPGRSRV